MGTMELQEATDLVRQTLVLSMMIAAPILLIGLGVGLIISLLQAVTQIQEQSLAFIPKTAAMSIMSERLKCYRPRERSINDTGGRN